MPEPLTASYPSVLAVSSSGGPATPRPFINSSIQAAVDKAMASVPGDAPGAKLQIQGSDGHVAVAAVWKIDKAWTVGLVVDHRVGTSLGKGTDWAVEAVWKGGR